MQYQNWKYTQLLQKNTLFFVNCVPKVQFILKKVQLLNGYFGWYDEKNMPNQSHCGSILMRLLMDICRFLLVATNVFNQFAAALKAASSAQAAQNRSLDYFFSATRRYYMHFSCIQLYAEFSFWKISKAVIHLWRLETDIPNYDFRHKFDSL